MSGPLRVYQHRVNSLPELRSLPAGCGVECDLREADGRVMVTHDMLSSGPPLEEYLAALGQRPVIFNVKCEGLEQHVRSAAAERGIGDYFFLDLSVPAALKLARQGERRFAVRYSEMEPVEAVLPWRGLASWVWVDCFTHWPQEAADWVRLARDFRLCLVSPELEGYDRAVLPQFLAELGQRPYHAVCTKYPDAWSV